MMTSLHGTRTSLYYFAFIGACCGSPAMGCEHAEQQKSAPPPVAVGGSSTAQTSSAGGSNSLASGGGISPGVGGGSDVNGTSGGTATGGANASGGTTAATVATTGGTAMLTTCASDIDCKAQKLLCDIAVKQCVQCVQSVDCTDGKACVAGVCGGAAGCNVNTDCAASTEGKICDVNRGRCVVCVTGADCPNPNASECVANACVPVATCTNSLDCTSSAAPICNRAVTPGRCVQCVANADCVASGAGKVCSENLCRTSCSTNSDCSAGLRCNTSVVPNFCATCATHSDCAAAQYCQNGSCAADVCVGGTDQACVSNAIATCNPDGDGFGASQACPSGQTCSVTASRATCGTATTTPTTCATSPGTSNPCTKIPAFTATQTVDGKGEDFCGVGAFELSFKIAAGVNNNKVTGGSTADFTQRAVAQVAWSAAEFHAFVQVFGTPVRANTTAEKPWDGDSIELMVTTANSATGLTSKDTNSLHIIANHGVAVTVKSDGTSGTHAPITDSAQFKGLQTSTGYIVELKVPWPGAPVLASGTPMRFDMAMNVDTATVDPTVQGRDAQAVLAMTALSGETTCGSTPPTPFCDNRLWCPTALE